MAVWCTADRSGGGDASGMPDPEMCISGRSGSGGAGGLAGEEVRIKSFSPLKRKKAVLFVRKEWLLAFVGN